MPRNFLARSTLIILLMLLGLMASLFISLIANSSPSYAFLPSGTPLATEAPPEIEVLFDQARALYRANRPQAALSKTNYMITQLIDDESDPTIVFRTYFLRGQVYQSLADYSAAIEDFDHAISLQEDIGEVYAARAEAYQQLGDLDLALTDYSQAIEYDASETSYYLARGNIHLTEARHLAAIDDFTQVIGLSPEEKTAWLLRGMAYASLEEYQNALSDFDEVVALDADDLNVYRERGYAYVALEENDKASADFAKYLAQNPAASDVLEIQALIRNLEAE